MKHEDKLNDLYDSICKMIETGKDDTNKMDVTIYLELLELKSKMDNIIFGGK